MSARLGIAGLGRMGAALARRFAGQGCAVTGWSRSGVPEGLGIAPAPNLAALAAASDILILSLLDDAAVAAVLDALADTDLAGKLIVETSTIRPTTLTRRQAALAAAGASVIDAPISGGPEMIAAGKAGSYIGGAEADVARFLPFAGTFAARVIHVGSLGQGYAAKIVNNTLLCGFWETLREAVLIGRRSGLDLETMIGILQGSPGAPPAFAGRLPLLRGESDAVGFSANGVLKDLVVFRGTAAALGVETPVLDAAEQGYAAQRDAGLGEADLALMVRLAYEQG